MSAIHVSHLSFSYASANPVIEDASFDLGSGWTGLVGANGSGKSTLLHLIAGNHEPDSGSVTVVPGSGRVILCEQRIDELQPSVIALGDAWDGDSVRLRGALALDAADLSRWPTLSPGERKRWQVGAALSVEPQVLLLDEPTNHLDTGARDLLMAALSSFIGCGVVVSHDRHLLGTLTTRTLRMNAGSVGLWSGPYERARESWLSVAAAERAEYDKLKRERMKTRRRLADQRRRAEQKDAERYRVRKSAGKHDLDARGAVATGRHAGGQAAGAKERAATRSRLEAIDEAMDTIRVERERGGSISFDFEPARKEVLIHHDGPVEAGSRELFEARLVVRRQDRVRIAGVNGVGKTSLIRSLLNEASIPVDRMLYLHQETSMGEALRILEAVHALPGEDKGRVMALVALLGTDPGPLLSSNRLSPGETRKLALALGLGTPRWLLALDEPTNHLDLPAIERLEEALGGFGGALLLISHDDHLAGMNTDRTWLITDNGVEET